MTEKPILFSGPMVRAILDGRKTQTRRVLKPQPLPPVAHWIVDGQWFIPQALSDAVKQRYITTWPNHQKSRYGKVGDFLWVRERWAKSLHTEDGKPSLYLADSDILADGNKWRPSIHMPRWASRITLEVTAVKVERLKDISDEDAKAEGIQSRKIYSAFAPHTVFGVGEGEYHAPSAVSAFRDLWDSINGPGSWDANPWVAAYSFKRVLPE